MLSTLASQAKVISSLSDSLSIANDRLADAELKLSKVDTLSSGLQRVSAKVNTTTGDLNSALERIDALDTTNKASAPCDSDATGMFISIVLVPGRQAFKARDEVSFSFQGYVTNQARSVLKYLPYAPTPLAIRPSALQQ